MIAIVEDDGWYHIRTTGSHRHYNHPTKKGLVTVAGKPSEDIPIKTLEKIFKQAQLPFRKNK